MKSILLLAISGLRRINIAAEEVLKPIAWIGIAVMLLTVVLSVFGRKTGISMPWTEKAFIVMLPVSAFVIAPIAYRRAANVSLDFFHDMLGGRIARLHLLIIHLILMLLFMIGLDLTFRKVGIRFMPTEIFLDWLLGLDLASIRPFKARVMIPVLNLPWRYVYFSMPICMTLMLLANFELILRYVLGLFDPNDERVRPVRSFEEVEANRAE
ncbi:TRAP transporter small permease [Pelagibius sp. Alg239-R121]|uniref:TRAP transporter small permease n=1 Tax=Pelagibius sp. Alg239-R121 TaxID=2993448 RepID=UPI0024A636BE|nr:TRAP transporter small permease subunit [Pelagibius sp. Alg239-R121]